MEGSRLNKAAIQNYYADDYGWCYGCGRLNPHGHHFETYWEGEETVTVYEPRPEHMAIPGFVYGGLLAAIIDCHSTGSAALAQYRHEGHEPGDAAPVPRFVTASLKVDFRKPTPIDTSLTVRGRIVEVGAKKVIIHSDLYAHELVVVQGEVVAVQAPKTMTAHA